MNKDREQTAAHNCMVEIGHVLRAYGFDLEGYADGLFLVGKQSTWHMFLGIGEVGEYDA